LQLLDRISLQFRAIILEELIVRHLEFRSRSERSLLRKKRFKIAEPRGAIGPRPGAVARDAVEIVRSFDRCARRQFRPRHRRLRPAGPEVLVAQRIHRGLEPIGIGLGAGVQLALPGQAGESPAAGHLDDHAASIGSLPVHTRATRREL